MPFLPPNQHRQSTEGNIVLIAVCCNYVSWQLHIRAVTTVESFTLASTTLQARSKRSCVYKALDSCTSTATSTKFLTRKSARYSRKSAVLLVHTLKSEGSPYSIAERTVPELIPILGSQPWVINPAVGCHYFSPGLQLPSQPLRGLQPISLFGEQRHNGCEQFA